MCRLCPPVVMAGSYVAMAFCIATVTNHSLKADDPSPPFGMSERIPWTTSRIVGSPDPPLPYTAIKSYVGLNWNQPLYIKAEPHSNHLLVIQQGGKEDQPSKILRMLDRDDVDAADVVLEMPGRLVYGLEFDPNFLDNGFVYLFSNGPTGQPQRVNRISRFTVVRALESVTPWELTSELPIIEWPSMGHDGGDLAFGPDNLLYATSGDGTSDSDNQLSAQDVSNLLGGVLRIDVRQASLQRPYRIPSDNPFNQVPGARGELWAIGLRNPWRMSIDGQTGQIWVGNNGQDLWETIHLIRPGENYGWSVYEGSHPFYTQRRLGPGKLTAPTFEHHHTEARSLTGGVVYRGHVLPELHGAYIYGDYSTGKIWAGRHDGTAVTWHREIADTSLQIAGFANTPRGELLIVDHAGGIYRLAPNETSLATKGSAEFPKMLSQTGLFQSVKDHRVAPGVISYSVIAPAWNDGATAERYAAIPGDDQIDYVKSRGWTFNDGAVLMQTLSYDFPVAVGEVPRRLETRILTRQQGEWAGYSYRWNVEQTDATLVPAEGGEIDWATPATSEATGGLTNWRIPSRADCMSCHSRAVNFVLGITELQLNCEHDYAGRRDNQIRSWQHVGLVKSLPPKLEELEKLVDPHDSVQDLELRVKSYLHTNCSGCHVNAGGGNSRMQLDFVTPLEKMLIVEHFPQHDTFQIPQPMIVAPAVPERSVMLARLSRRGRGQMPPLGSAHIDEQAVALMRRWIESLQPTRQLVREWTVADVQNHLDAPFRGRTFASGEALFRTAGCAQCHRLTTENSGIGPNLTGIAQRATILDILTSILSPSAKISAEYARTRVATHDGEIVLGQLVSESDVEVVLRGTDSTATQYSIAKSEIAARSLSTVSVMPEGTVNHLQLDELLDLLAYLWADGNPEHAAFQPLGQ